MKNDVESLTDKERVTLRLMVRGHDAKSMASELNLSVHTINERLRSARRKLSVTSSREAARLLHESEGGAYETFAYKQLRDAHQGSDGETGQKAVLKPSRRILLGSMIMLVLFAAGLILTSQLSEQATDNSTQSVHVVDAAIAEAARNWLELVDEGDWQASFETAGAAFKDVNTVSGWAGASRQVRVPLGPVVSRELLSIRSFSEPPRTYQEVKFMTEFANQPSAFETVTLEREDNVWKVVGIVIE